MYKKQNSIGLSSEEWLTSLLCHLWITCNITFSSCMCQSSILTAVDTVLPNFILYLRFRVCILFRKMETQERLISLTKTLIHQQQTTDSWGILRHNSMFFPIISFYMVRGKVNTTKIKVQESDRFIGLCKRIKGKKQTTCYVCWKFAS